MLGAAVLFAGVVVGGVIFVTWAQRGFGELAEQRLSVVAATLAIVGVQIIFSSFLISILGLRRRG
jgi:hypothetical protein